MEFGLHDHPAIAASVFGPAALVYSQGRDAAEQALALRLAELENLRLRVVTEMQVRIALGEYDIASDLLWNYWKSLDQEGFSDDFWELHADYLCAAATIAGHTERLGVMLPMLHESVAKDSKLHNGDYQMNQATLAIFEGRHEDAIERYQVIADNGGIGDFTHNSPIHFGFLVADDSRYDAVRAQLTANRDRQLQELNQLRESGVSVRQMRQDYLAQLP
jgi:hypothetical protein